MIKKLLIITLMITVAGCKASDQPRPLRTAVQPPSPRPSWAAGMEPGCWTIGEPVAPECLEGGAPECSTWADRGPCWYVDPVDGTVWYRP